MKRLRLSASALLTMTCMTCMPVHAASEFIIEEIIVTAQRMEESAGSVPIALNAFNDTMIEDRQIVALADLQIFSPNLSYTTNNVGDMNISVRGVGSLVSVNDGESGVSLHVNEVPLAPGQPPIELYDVERLEVLRGPQGTLYGRNATGGAINIITKKPNFDGVNGYLDAEAGEHDLLRVRGALNVPIGDYLAFRIAGLSIDRDGYTDNLAGGQVPGISDHVDGRDLWSVRASATWRISDRTEVRTSYERFDEDDDRLFTHNFLCQTALTAGSRVGCEPGVFALEPSSPAGFGNNFSNGLLGIIPIGAGSAEQGLTFAFPRPNITDLRDVHMDFEPIFELEQDIWQLGFRHAFDWGELNFNGGYQEWARREAFDADWSVSYELAPIGVNPSGLYPVSSLAGGVDSLSGDVCNIEAGEFGVLGGCALRTDLTRHFTYQDKPEEREQYSAEIRLHTTLDGRFNVLVGANYASSKAHSVNALFNNTGLDVNTNIGALTGPGLFIPLPDFLWRLYPGVDVDEAKLEFESTSAFGELYLDLSDSLRLTLGVRYNRDEKDVADRNILITAFDLNSPIVFNGALGPDPVWARLEAFNPDSGVAEFYGVSPTGGLAPIAAGVPLVPQLNESRLIQGLPTSETWDAWTGRAALRWQASDSTTLYASYARGYKPGGFNPGTAAGFLQTEFTLEAEPAYEREDVDAFEVGMKGLWLGGALSVNAAAFFNDYTNLQMSQTILEMFSAAASNTNVDAEMYGLELETRWRPAFAPRAELELGYSWLHAEIKNEPPRIDPLDGTGGNPDYVELASIGGTRFVARTEDVLTLVDEAISSGAAVPPNFAPFPYANGIPALWYNGAIIVENGFEVIDGVPVPVDGNRLPETPEHTVHLAASYTWDVAAGQLTARWDYYWQDSAFLTIYNRPSHKIDSWDQHNATLIYESGTGRWSARAWIKNIENDTHITGGHRSNVQAFAVSDPRAFGASLRWNFGAI